MGRILTGYVTRKKSEYQYLLEINQSINQIIFEVDEKKVVESKLIDLMDTILSQEQVKRHFFSVFNHIITYQYV